MFEIYFLLWFWFGNYDTLPCTGSVAGLPHLQIPPYRNNLKSFHKAEELKDITEPERPICLIPTSRTFPTLSAVILTGNAVITLQITIVLK